MRCLSAAGLNVHLLQDEAGLQWLRQLDKQGSVLGGICTGTYLLARGDFLNDHRCTIHWENLAAAREEFPHLVISPELYEIDRRRLYLCRWHCTIGYDAQRDSQLSWQRACHTHIRAVHV